MLAICVTMVSWLAYSSTLKMEAISFSESSFNFERTIRHYIHRRVSFKSCISSNRWKFPWNFFIFIIFSHSFGFSGWYTVVSLSSSFLTSEREKRQPESNLLSWGGEGLISVTSFCERNTPTVNLVCAGALHCRVRRTNEILVLSVECICGPSFPFLGAGIS
jgi:hypothetical protein